MFVELLPDVLHLPLAWMSFLIAVGGTAAVGWYWLRKYRAFRSSDHSVLDDD